MKTTFQFHTLRSSSQTRGSILVLTAICMFALIAIVSLAVDAVHIQNLQEKMKLTSNAASLAALKAYLDYPCTTGTCEHERRQAGKDAALSLVKMSIVQAPGIFSGDASSMSDLSLDSGYGANGSLELGRWEEQNLCLPADHCPNTCFDDLGEKCFQPISEALSTDPTNPILITAAQVRFKTGPNTPWQAIFARVLGIESYSLETEAVSSIIPQHIVVGIDLSRSAVSQTHVPLEARPVRDPATFRPAEFSYILSGSNTSSCTGTFQCNTATHENQCLNNSSAYCAGGYCPIPENYQRADGSWNQTFGPMAAVYNSYLSPSRSLAVEADRPDLHYRDDHTCQVVSRRDCVNYATLNRCLASCATAVDRYNCLGSHPDCSASVAGNCQPYTPHLLVDSYYNPPTYTGPRPLYTYLEGMHQLTQSFESRSLKNDQLALIGFDGTSLTPQRIFEMSNTDGARFQDIKDITDVENHGPQFEQLLRHAFFPFANSDTNIPFFLRHALMMLKDAPNAPPQRALSVILFSDGIVNCNVDASGNSICGNTSQPYDGANGSFVAGRNEIKNKIIPDFFVKAGVRLHMFLSGQVEPHTTIVKKDGRCIFDPVEATNAGLNTSGMRFVDPSLEPGRTPAETFKNYLDPQYPFREPNSFADDVIKTGGYFVPLRPPCVLGTDITPNIANRPLGPCLNTGPTSGRVFQGQTLTAHDLGITGNTTVVIKNGRVICDLQGRSESEQVSRYMERIMAENTAFLVK